MSSVKESTEVINSLKEYLKPDITRCLNTKMIDTILYQSLKEFGERVCNGEELYIVYEDYYDIFRKDSRYEALKIMSRQVLSLYRT